MLTQTFTPEATPTPKPKPAHKVVMLSHKHAKAVHLLIETVRATLPEDEKIFLKPRSHGSISAHFAGFNPAFGILTPTGQLIGCALLCPINDASDEYNQKNYPAEHLLPGHWALQSVARHPAYEGQGLMGMLLDAAKAHAAANPQVSFMIAKVNGRNAKSQEGFAKAGFTQAAQGQDHASGEAVVYLGLHTGSGLAQHGGHSLQLGQNDPAHTPFS
jgi:RimJ/RimL family protein N-acetyltransferase